MSSYDQNANFRVRLQMCEFGCVSQYIGIYCNSGVEQQQDGLVMTVLSSVFIFVYLYFVIVYCVFVYLPIVQWSRGSVLSDDDSRGLTTQQ